MRIEAEAPRRRSVGLTPLIDVVFLLLLFFMLASSFSRYATVEVGIGGNAPAAVEPPKTVLLSVGAEGRYMVNGTQTPVEQVAEALRAAAGDEDRTVIVRPAGSATAQDIVSGLEAASASAVGDVVLVR